mmetsp:Transcript_3370/g.3499  ORF Transcript_3370/g.3499 Transcript_3370/m.3499 type:complete len:217 (-) Transcript_3370:112-762(-)
METRKRLHDSDWQQSGQQLGQLQEEDEIQVMETKKSRKRSANEGRGGLPQYLVGGTTVSPDAPDVYFVYDRRIRGSCFLNDPSLYSLLRSWVHDDPNRKTPSVIPRGAKVEVMSTKYDDLLDHLLLQLKPQPKIKYITDFSKVINSMESIPQKDFMIQHVAHLKQVKKVWRQVAAIKYLQYNEHLTSKGIPKYESMEKLLRDTSERSIQSLANRMA